METYENIETGEKIYTDGVVDEKYKTIFAQTQSGKTISMSISTFEKYWRQVDIPVVGLS